MYPRIFIGFSVFKSNVEFLLCSKKCSDSVNACLPFVLVSKTNIFILSELAKVFLRVRKKMRMKS